MASTFTDLGIELMATGENAGTWGTKTNNNLSLFEQLTGGFNTQSIAGGAQTTALTVVDGNTTGTAQHRMIEFTGTITGNQIVTIPLDVETFYYLRNSTSGAYTVQFKYVSGSGDTFTFSATDKGDQLVFATANDGTNPDIYSLGFGDVTLTGTETLTNKTLTSPKIGTAILDTGGNELINVTATGSAVNEITLANAATGNAPSITASGETNVDLNLSPKGLGRVTLGASKIEQLAEKATIAATAATGTITFDVITQAVLYFTTNAAANYTLNIRGDGSNSLNNIMDTGESLTIAHLVTQGSTPYYNNVVQIDGSTVTPEWQGGSAPSAGNASSVDVYSYTIIKTGDAAFTVFAAQTQFA
tara:strand:+ start:298 stop:1377 length:1080 start_codon:yes stop_codon:yes gene_type:complete